MEKFPLVGRYRFVLKRGGSPILFRAGKNLMVTAGKNRAAQVLVGGASPLGFYLAFGDNGATPALGQTALSGTELMTRELLAVVVSGNIIEQSDTIVYAGAPVVVREMGIFSAIAAGTLVSRWLPNEFTFSNGDSMEFTWSLEVG